MNITVSRFTVTKRYALTISRGTSAGSENVLVAVEHEGVTGLGEMAPTSGGAVAETAETAEADLRRWTEKLTECAPWEMQRIEAILDAEGGGHAARAALDIALHDWQGRRLGLPVWKLFGLDPARIPPTSLTLGINPPEVIRERVPEILARTGAQALKVKLGSPAGLEADQAMFAAAQEAATRPVLWRVDANGGWSVEGARTMLRWLAARGVEFVEQPLPRGQEADLPAVHWDSPLPLFVDESVYLAADIPPLAASIDGVNLKLMKCGGLREALRIFHTARAHGLKVMMGCMSESSLAITAAAHLSPLADALDLDSHLNLNPDPFCGAVLCEGRILPTDAPGLGVSRVECLEGATA
ncbi:MAG TPA: dipeptide epimerase [Chthonomonadaceae bacterium]|nr:dipeptide epimerase [Chthonomonadaceae bacterium]